MRFTIILFAFFIASCTSKKQTNPEVVLDPPSNVVAPRKMIVAYVTSWTNDTPDPRYLTHINYAFGHVTDDFSGVRIDNPQRLKDIVNLKKGTPTLKVMLSIEGWGSGKFSEMAGLESNRKKFAKDCFRMVQEFGLDGIDIDWEYPTSGSAGISSSPNDTQNYTLLMSEIRSQIGKEKLLTLASSANAGYIDFKAIEPVIDFVNIMTYDMSNPPYHQAGLYRSKYTQWLSVDEAVKAHKAAGIPMNKLVLGMPFYGHGKDGIPDFIDYKEVVKLTGFIKKWDDVAKAPFLENANGEFVCTYDDPRSIKAKCNYILEQKMLGAMCWEYSGDTADGVLRKTIFDTLK
jgi:chitinase